MSGIGSVNYHTKTMDILFPPDFPLSSLPTAPAAVLHLHLQHFGEPYTLDLEPTHREDAHILGQLGHHRGGPRTGTPAHARSDEDKVSALHRGEKRDVRRDQCPALRGGARQTWPPYCCFYLTGLLCHKHTATIAAVRTESPLMLEPF